MLISIIRTGGWRPEALTPIPFRQKPVAREQFAGRTTDRSRASGGPRTPHKYEAEVAVRQEAKFPPILNLICSPQFKILALREGLGMKSIIGIAALLVLCPALAAAKPVQTTKYTYYTVGGNTAESVYKAMLSKGPRVNGAKAYAATTATTRQDGKLMQSNACKIQDYQLRLDFVIKLPKIRNEKALAPADRTRWRQFAAFLKTHEETHRSIWLECAAEMERKVRSIKAKTCDEADAKAEALWEQTRAACSKKHDAFDRAEQKKLMKHPFVQLVYKRSSSMTHAASSE